MQYAGNKELLRLDKSAFLCSQKCPAAVVLKCYDWAKQQREVANCVVCGNHSQMEKDVFEILLKGSQALILVLARGMKTQWDTEIKKAINENRLLIISPFDTTVKRVTRESAAIRNQKIVELSDRLFVGFKTENGLLDKLLRGKEYQLL